MRKKPDSAVNGKRRIQTLFVYFAFCCLHVVLHYFFSNISLKKRNISHKLLKIIKKSLFLLLLRGSWPLLGRSWALKTSQDEKKTCPAVNGKRCIHTLSLFLFFAFHVLSAFQTKAVFYFVCSLCLLVGTPGVLLAAFWSLLGALGPLLAALGPLLAALGPLLAALGPLLGRSRPLLGPSWLL